MQNKYFLYIFIYNMFDHIRTLEFHEKNLKNKSISFIRIHDHTWLKQIILYNHY